MSDQNLQEMPIGRWRWTRGLPRIPHAEAYVHSGDARESVVTGYGQSGRMVTAAAVIMTAVFGGLLLDPDPVVKSIGLSLAFGVLADAFVVRMTLVPAVWRCSGTAPGSSRAGSSGSCPTWTSRTRA